MKFFLCFLILFTTLQNIYGDELTLEFNVMIYPDSTGEMHVTDLAKMINQNDLSLFSQIVEKRELNSTITYWLYLQKIPSVTTQDYVFTLNDRLSSVEVYNRPFLEPTAIAGMLIPGNKKSLIGDKLILQSESESYLIKIENKLHALTDFSSLKIIPYPEYLVIQNKNDFIHGILQGAFLLILIYNIILYILVKRRIHLYYVIHIFLNALTLSAIHQLSERYLFPHHPELNLVLLSFQIIGMFFYLQFLRSAMLRHCTAYTREKDKYRLLPFSIFILIANVLISGTIIFRLDLFTIASRLSNVVVSAYCIAMFISYFNKSDRFLRIIIIGSMILVAMGCTTIYISTFHVRTDIYYSLGLLIELLLLTYALNSYYFKEKNKVDIRNRYLEFQTEIKDRELLNKALQLQSKEQVISSVKEKLKHPDTAENGRSHIFSELEVSDKIEKVLWSEFEKHFISIYPEFYKNITSSFPQLSQSEIRLCAFLRLNLNTKEIATITQKSAHSIETMRSRIRQKLNLERQISLSSFLMQEF